MSYHRLLAAFILLLPLQWTHAEDDAPSSPQSIRFDEAGKTPPPERAVVIGQAGANGYASSLMGEGLPVGNGTLGAFLIGGMALERIVLNEHSLWSGNCFADGIYGPVCSGNYQTLGNLWIHLPGHEKGSNYRRSLDLSTALVTVQYDVAGVTYKRELFASYPDKVVALRLTASRPGALTGDLEWQDAHGDNVAVPKLQIPTDDFIGHDFKQKVTPAGIRTSGALHNNLRFATGFTILHQGGEVGTDGRKVIFKGVDSLTVLMAAGTDYAEDYAKHYRSGEDPSAQVEQQLKAAAAKSYDALKAAHETDYQSFFNRVRLNLGQSTAGQRSLPTGRRKRQAIKTFDPEYEALQFQFGRYLLIACSRPGSLPANLEGMWNDVNDPPLASDYHTNINVEMNYWPAEATNLSECHLPLFDLVRSQVEGWRQDTAANPREWLNPFPGAKPGGWAVRTSHNIMGLGWWKWDNTANAWYMHHFWERYQFTQDKEWLRTIAWPLMKEVAEFWLCRLKKLPDGRLAVPNGWSPEHGPTEDGVSYCQQIIWDHFTNTVEAADILGEDKAFRNQLATARDALAGPRVGSWGQLLEWLTEKKGMGELDTPQDHHRHTSHLFAVYPGRQISVATTPEWADAARVSLVARSDQGSDVTEWAFAWRTALYARLRDGDMAHHQLLRYLDRTYDNMFGWLNCFQIDGNFGITAAMAEMLVQSHAGSIDLLPALPKEWRTGMVTGLRARGGYEVDASWKDGTLDSATVKNISGHTANVTWRGKRIVVSVPPGQRQTLLLSDFH
jgi:alpha-L-fucosidase 2